MFKFVTFIWVAVFIVTLFTLSLFVNKISAAGDPVVAASGDMVCGAGSTGAACKQMATSDLIIGMSPAAVLVLGDNQYEEGKLSDFQNYYQPSYGRFKSITYPSVGNHEYLTPGASGYFDYFNGVGNANGIAGNRSQGYYAFNIGNWRLYALNSNCSQAGGCNAGSPQDRWLRADLAANPHQCVLAYFHHPLFTSGSRASAGSKPLYQALYDYGGDLILTGHEHNYERFAPQDPNGVYDAIKGAREYVVGTGGRNFTQFVSNAPNSQVKNDTTFGVLKLTLHSGSYDAEFVPIAGSSFTDKIVNQSCSGSATSTPPPTVNPTSTTHPTASGLVNIADVNGDSKVDIIDIGIVVDNYKRLPITNIKADVNKDGVVDIVDIGIIIDYYGK